MFYDHAMFIDKVATMGRYIYLLRFRFIAVAGVDQTVKKQIKDNFQNYT